MKKVLWIVIYVLLVIPVFVKADETKYTHLNLEEALLNEQIDKEFSSYTESDDKITIWYYKSVRSKSIDQD